MSKSISYHSCLIVLFGLLGCGATDPGEKLVLTYPNDWEVQHAPDEGIEEIAFSPMEGSKDMFRENINIVAGKLPYTMPLDAYIKATKKNMSTSSKFKSLEFLNEANGKVGDASYSEMVITFRIAELGNTKVKSILFVFVRGTKAFVVTCSALSGTFDRFEKPFRETIATAKFVK